MINFIGWLAGFLFAFCGAPQAYKSYKDGHSKGLSHLFLTMWTSGEILTIIYVLFKHGFDGPLMFNYTANLVFLVIIYKYKIFPRHKYGGLYA